MLGIICFTIALQFYAVYAFGLKAGDLRTDGDILIGGLFPIHEMGTNGSKCGSFNSNPGYQYMEAMLYALDTINADPAILPGIKLGSVIADTCNNEIISLKQTEKFIKILFVPESTNYSELVSVVGPMLGKNAKLVANIVRGFHIPQISYGAMSSDLSNKNLYKYFFRTVAPNEFFYAAMAAFLGRMGWRYVGLAYSDRIWLQINAAQFEYGMKHKGVCVGPHIRMSHRTTDEDLDRYIAKLVSGDSEPKVVILVTSTRESRAMLAAKKRNPRGNELTFVAGVTWNNRKSITQDYKEIAEGTFTFGHRQGSIPEFEEYFHALRYNTYTRSNKYWIGKYWQETHQCNLRGLGIPSKKFTKNCTGDENNAIYKEFAAVQVVINAVYAVANALDSLQKHFCPNVTGICSKMRPISTRLLLEYIKNTTFEDALSHSTTSFNSHQEVNGNYTVYNYRYINGSYDYVPVGSWSGVRGSDNRLVENLLLNESVMEWAHVNAVMPLLTCRPNCRHGQIRVPSKPRSSCCWDCHTCEENEAVMNNTCQACVPGFNPGKNFTSCLKMDLIYVNMDTTAAIVLVVFSVLGIITDLVFLTAFLIHRNHPLIKASGREMCCIIFGGIATIFITSLTTLVKPTKEICSTRRILAGISFTICYAPLLMKIWRIHRIFQRTNKLKRLSSGGLLGLGPMIGITCIIIAINVLCSASIANIDPTEVAEKFYEDKEELILECTMNTTVFISIFAYNMMLLLGCTVYAFLTRHFPKNFNEATYIGITLYLTCVVWVVFFANYLNSADSISRVYWISGASLLIGWITLLGLFAPKFYHVYTKPEVSREMLITWNESSRRRSEDVSGRCEECRQRAEALRKYSKGIGSNKSSASKISYGISRNDLSATKTSNGIDRNQSSVSKDSNDISRYQSSLSNHSNGIGRNESSATLQQIGIDNLTILADTQM